jgi:hypothetical protein
MVELPLSVSWRYEVGGEVQLHSFLTSALDGGDWSTSFLSCFHTTAQKNPSAHRIGGLGGCQRWAGRFRRRENLLSLLGFEPRTVQPIVSVLLWLLRCHNRDPEYCPVSKEWNPVWKKPTTNCSVVYVLGLRVRHEVCGDLFMSLREGMYGRLEVYLAHFLLPHDGREVSNQLRVLSALLLGEGLFSTHWFRVLTGPQSHSACSGGNFFVPTWIWDLIPWSPIP